MAGIDTAVIEKAGGKPTSIINVALDVKVRKI